MKNSIVVVAFVSALVLLPGRDARAAADVKWVNGNFVCGYGTIQYLSDNVPPLSTITNPKGIAFVKTEFMPNVATNPDKYGTYPGASQIRVIAIGEGNNSAAFYSKVNALRMALSLNLPVRIIGGAINRPEGVDTWSCNTSSSQFDVKICTGDDLCLTD